MNNILLDAGVMYPDGFHPVAMIMAADCSSRAKYISRTSAGAKYYYVDFGISSYFPEDVSKRIVKGVFGRDQGPPELSPETLYDPFKLDIFILGSMFKKEFCDVIIPLSVVSSRNSQGSRNTPTLSSCTLSSRR